MAFLLYRLALAFLTLVVIAISAHPTPPTTRSRTPSTDPFYQPPAGYESEAPGAILRQRTIVASFFGLIPNPVKGYQLLYRTTAIDGSAIATVTTVFKPLNASLDRVISFQTAYDASSTACDPSYNYELGHGPTDLISSIEMLIIEAYLLLGYIVVSSDYEGPDAAFGVGQLAGIAVLDGIRAVGNFQSTLGLSSSNPMVVGVGYSGGGHASGWAASLQPSYAPELNVRGWAMGDSPSNMTETLVAVDGTIFSGFLPIVINGFSKASAYGPQINPLISQSFTTTGQGYLTYASSHCTIACLLNAPEVSMASSAVQSLGSSFFENSPFATALGENCLGAEHTPSAPVFLYHAKQDEIVPYAVGEDLNSAWCGNGASVKFTTYGNGGHFANEVISIPDVINYVKGAFAGTLRKGCSQNVEFNSALNPLALGVEIEPILTALLQVTVDLGTNDGNVLKNLDVLEKLVL